MSEEKKEVGTIKRINDIKVISDKFKELKFHIETDGEYPQVLEFQATNDHADNFIKFNKVGEKVEVLYNNRGREWTNPDGVLKVFNTMTIWRVNKVNSDIPKETKPTTEDDLSDLPF